MQCKSEIFYMYKSFWQIKHDYDIAYKSVQKHRMEKSVHCTCMLYRVAHYV